jgi:hypothetical protein
MKNTDMKTVQIYMPLKDEGSPTVRPVDAESQDGDIYRILSTQVDDTEVWEFPTGSLVRCRIETWSAREVLVARELVSN